MIDWPPIQGGGGECDKLLFNEFQLQPNLVTDVCLSSQY